MSWCTWVILGALLVISAFIVVIIHCLERLRNLAVQIAYLQGELTLVEQERDRERRLANEYAASAALLTDAQIQFARVLMILHALRDEGLMPQGTVPIWLQQAIRLVESWFCRMVPVVAQQEALLAAACRQVAHDLPLVATARSRRAAG